MVDGIEEIIVGWVVEDEVAVGEVAMGEVDVGQVVEEMYWRGLPKDHYGEVQ